jgi:GcrA cell cycle regulator
MAPTAWTDEEIALLRQLWAEGLKTREIAERIPTHGRNSVIGKAHRLKLEARTASRTRGPGRKLTGRKKRRWKPRPQPPLPPPKPFDATLVFGYRMRPVRHPAVIQLRANGEPEPLNLSIYQLSMATCKWPHGIDPPFQFCGHRTQEGEVYCPHHAKVAQPWGGRRR